MSNATTDYNRDPTTGSLCLNKSDMVRMRLLEKNQKRSARSLEERITLIENSQDLIIKLLTKLTNGNNV